jgi:hypothetical protein
MNMTTVVGPFDQGDFKTMHLLRQNIDFYKKKDREQFGDTVTQYDGMLKDMYRMTVH